MEGPLCLIKARHCYLHGGSFEVFGTPTVRCFVSQVAGSD